MYKHHKGRVVLTTQQLHWSSSEDTAVRIGWPLLAIQRCRATAGDHAPRLQVALHTGAKHIFALPGPADRDALAAAIARLQSQLLLSDVHTAPGPPTIAEPDALDDAPAKPLSQLLRQSVAQAQS